MQHLCPRCRQAITTADEGTLRFCVHCGAPQVRVHPDLLAAPVAASEHGAEPGPPPLLAANNWRGAIQCAALAGAIALSLAALATVIPPIAALDLLWAISAPVIVMGFYHARFPASVIRPRFGARLGLLTGGAVMLGTLIVDVTEGVLSRFVFHTSGALDTALANTFTEAQQRAAAMSVGQQADTAAQIAHFLSVPEFRAALLLMLFTFPVVIYLLLSTAGGAFAGFLRSRSVAR